MIIAEKMFPEYGRDEFFLSQTERIALNACLEAVRIEVAGKVKLNRSGSARSKVGRSVPQGDFHSGDFLMEVPNCELGENGLFVFADCAVNPDLDSEKLAEVAALSADSFKSFVGAEPKVAMLSFSSYGSAKHERVTMVADAVKIANEKYPDIAVDGELQLDAALVPEVAALKAPNSEVAGKANTLVFPSLEAGNIGYKLVQRLAKAGAYGPVLQGLSMPVNDLSRGCFAEDIVGVVAMTAVQAQDAAK